MSERRHPSLRVVVLVLLGLGLAGVLAWWEIPALHGPTKASLGLAVWGDIEVTTVEVSFKIPGRLADRKVDEGDRVRAKQLVALLDPTDAQSQLGQAGAGLQVARANSERAHAAYEEVLAGSRPQDVAAAAAALSEAETAARQTSTDFERMRNLHAAGAIANRDFESARSARDTAEARVSEAQQRYDMVRIGPRKEDIDQALAAWHSAQAAVLQAQQAVNLAQCQLGYTRLYAPVSGVVTAKNAERGEVVAPGTPVLTVADLEHTWMRAYVGEADLGRVHVGETAHVRSDSYPGKVYPGRVSFIAQNAEFTPKNVETPQDRVKLVYRIKIDVPNPSDDLKPGMPGDAELLDPTASAKAL